jgi:hypothetical protein
MGRKLSIENTKEEEKTTTEENTSPDAELDLDAAEVEEAETLLQEEAEEETKEEAKTEEKPKRKPRQRKPKVVEASKTDEDETEAPKKEKRLADTKADADDLAKPWAAFKDISVALSVQLEKIAAQMKEMQDSYQEVQQEVNQQKHSKNTMVQKAALSAAGIAFIFSIISLTLSQSARQATLANAVNHNPSVASSPLVLEKKVSNEIAQRKKK